MRNDWRGTEAVATWLASSARAEAAAATAFASTVTDLHALDAPSELVDRAGRTLDEALRRARILRSLAIRRGGRPQPTVSEIRGRDRLGFAVENGVRGCVREGWTALVAHWQALHAADREIAAVFARIAVDAARHAELSADIDRWLQPQLGPRDRIAVANARRAAVDALGDGVEPDPDLHRIAGLPSASTTRRLLRALAAEGRDAGARAA